MFTTTVKAYGKINLSLNVLQKDGEYHSLDTVVTTVDKYDLIYAEKRKDKKILVTFTGRYAFVPKFQEQTNAYKACKLFMDEFGVNGANIEVVRSIPTGSGMGGSSCDVVGVLKAMKKLYKIQCDLKPLADKLGSDAGYLLNGGFARLTSRGEVVKELDVKDKYYFVCLYAKGAITAKECFEEFDKLHTSKIVSDNDELERALLAGDSDLVLKNVKNALLESALKISDEVAINLKELSSLCPDVCSMTGSGATVYCMFKEREMATWAYEKLRKKFGKDVELLSSYKPSKSFFWF